jgi:hypothetical protein
MYNTPDAKDKILCSLLYTGIFIPFATLAPIVWIVVANIKKIYLKEFVKYHCFQAVLFNMIIFFLPGLFDLLVSFIGNILEVFIVFAQSLNLPEEIQGFIISSESLLNLLNQFKALILQIYSIFIKVLTFYAIVWTARGKFTYIPPISQAVNQLLR